MVEVILKEAFGCVHLKHRPTMVEEGARANHKYKRCNIRRATTWHVLGADQHQYMMQLKNSMPLSRRVGIL
jgi:hypothetical protein